MKVYCYFHKDVPSELYAFTLNKEYKYLFEMQRCMSRFIYGKKKMTDDEFQLFVYKKHGCMLQEDYLTDNDNTIQVIMTQDESSQLSESCEYISDFLTTVKYELVPDNNKFRLKNKYLKFISEITEILRYDTRYDNILNINTFKLFYVLFKNTLDEEYTMEESR